MRVLILCNRYLSEFDRSVIQTIRASPDNQIVGVLINSKQSPGFLTKVKGEWKKGRGGYVLVQIFNGIKKRIGSFSSIQTADFLNDVPNKHSDSLYKSDIYDWIKEQAPDCIFLRGFGFIREPILSIVPYGVLSFHHGNMYRYRGGPPAFWELYNNEQEIGVTMQILDEGLDTGTVVLQKFFPVSKGVNWSTVRGIIYEGSVPMVLEALKILSENGNVRKPIGPVGKLYTLPNLKQWLTLQVRILKRKLIR